MLDRGLLSIPVSDPRRVEPRPRYPWRKRDGQRRWELAFAALASVAFGPCFPAAFNYANSQEKTSMSERKANEHLKQALKWAKKGNYERAQSSVFRATQEDYIPSNHPLLKKINDALKDAD